MSLIVFNTKNENISEHWRQKFQENPFEFALELLIASSIPSHEKLQNELKVLSFKAKQTNKIPRSSTLATQMHA
jgi:hypothetical protein